LQNNWILQRFSTADLNSVGAIPTVDCFWGIPGKKIHWESAGSGALVSFATYPVTPQNLHRIEDSSFLLSYPRLKIAFIPASSIFLLLLYLPALAAFSVSLTAKANHRAIMSVIDSKHPLPKLGNAGFSLATYNVRKSTKARTMLSLITPWLDCSSS
jgi:hypothetical protein